MVEILGLDYSGKPPGGDSIARWENGIYKFGARYLSPNTSRHPYKQLTIQEADDLRNHNLDIVDIWETTGARSLDGKNAGIEDAARTRNVAATRNKPKNRPFFFCAQDTYYEPGIFINVAYYFEGIVETLGKVDLVGAYCGYYLAEYLFKAQLIGRLWQTPAWSRDSDGKVKWHPNVDIKQFQPKATTVINGTECDVNTAVKEDYGQWGYFKVPSTKMKGLPEVFIMVKSNGQATRVYANGFDVYDNVGQVRAWQHADQAVSAAYDTHVIPTITSGRDGFTDEHYNQIIEDLKPENH